MYETTESAKTQFTMLQSGTASCASQASANDTAAIPAIQVPSSGSSFPIRVEPLGSVFPFFPKEESGHERHRPSVIVLSID